MTPILSLDAGIELLKKHADSIHNAELAALLHDVGKGTSFFRETIANCIDKKERGRRLHAIHYFSGRLLELLQQRTTEQDASIEHVPFGLRTAVSDIRTVESEFAKMFRGTLRETVITLPDPLHDRDYSMSDIAELYKVEPEDLETLVRKSSDLIDLMYVAHLQAKGQEARPLNQEANPKRGRVIVELQEQAKPWLRSTVFGHEAPYPAPSMHEASLKMPAEAIRRLLGDILSDSRRPINDILASQMGSSTAAFLKSAIAHCVLCNSISSDDDPLAWGLLRIAINGPAYWSTSERIPDILVRREILSRLLDFLRDGFQREWLLGNEIYRDDCGSTFLIPGLFYTSKIHKDDLDKRIQDRWKSFRLNQSADLSFAEPVCDELSYSLCYSPDFALGKQGKNSFLLGQLLATPPPPLQPDHAQISLSWADTPRAEVCSVCRLRPIGGTRKAADRKLCRICEERRQDRSRRWLTNGTQTIWTDEVADANGRIALVAARFRLENWVRKGGYIETTLRLGQDEKRKDQFKSPSFARIARVWDTTTEFWRTGLQQIEADSRISHRIRLTGAFTRKADVPVRGHAYCLRLPSGFRVSVVCASRYEESSHPQPVEFIVAENLIRACKLAGFPNDDYSDTLSAAQRLASALDGVRCNVEEPKGYNASDETIGTFAGTAVLDPVAADGTEGYSPVIRILEDPTMLMFLAPAQSAMRFADSLRLKYETEMARVRDRLPMDMALIYASSSNPIYALVDAARSMMEGLPRGSQEWRLAEDVKTDGRHLLVRFTNGVEWKYPVHMGDGITKDLYYLFFLHNDAPVHVSELKKDNVVSVEPSHFDFEFLDSSGRRFEIAYDDGKRRMHDVAQRPHLLDDIPRIGALWNTLNDGLETSQIRELDGLLAAKRTEWGKEMPSDFANWAVLARHWNGKVPRSQKQPVIEAAQSGLLHDVIEIHLGLERDRPR